MLDNDSLEMLNCVAEDFSTGHPKDGKAYTFNSRRAYATNIIKDTISNPDMIFHQKRENLSYVTYWRGSVKDMAHAVIVTVDKEHNGKIITALISADRSADSTHAMSGLRSEIKKPTHYYTSAIIYMSGCRSISAPRPVLGIQHWILSSTHPATLL